MKNRLYCLKLKEKTTLNYSFLLLIKLINYRVILCIADYIVFNEKKLLHRSIKSEFFTN